MYLYYMHPKVPTIAQPFCLVMSLWLSYIGDLVAWCQLVKHPTHQWIYGFLVFTGEANAQISLSRLAMLGPLWTT